MKNFSGSVENEDCNCKEYIKANERTLISCFSSTTFEKVGEGLSFSLFVFLYTKKSSDKHAYDAKVPNSY